MHKQEERFTKIYVFDLNPGNDDITKEFIMGKLSRIMKNISLYQYFVIVSHSSLKVLKKIIADAKINLGYIVSDSGARIYNISTKKIIYEKHIEKNDVLGISHCLTMSDVLQLVSIANNEFIYSFDSMNEYVFSKMHYINCNVITAYN
ncbi:MAG: HAD hydrolase family protein, partial [Mycoplasmoidaceae bacterium]|nr:HAD hydrolase family protein [Mycoplasmoidaceae bacterium]